MFVVPDPWVLMPAPLTGAALSMIADRSTVNVPELSAAPPPTEVVVFAVNELSSTVAVAPPLTAMAPPFAAWLPENVARRTISVPESRIAPPRPAVSAFTNSTPSTVTVAPADTCRILMVLVPSSTGVPPSASIVTPGPWKVTSSAVGLAVGSVYVPPSSRIRMLSATLAALAVVTASAIAQALAREPQSAVPPATGAA